MDTFSDASLPFGPIFFISMQFSRKFGRIINFGVGTYGKSWIRHWICMYVHGNIAIHPDFFMHIWAFQEVNILS